MKLTAKRVDECQTASDLASDQAGGRLFTDAERAFLEDHLRYCTSCRLEQAAAAVLAHTGDAGPALPVDEITRRRLVSDAVSAALAVKRGAESPAPAAREERGGRRRLLPWVALAAGIAGLGLGLGITWSGSGRDAAPSLLVSEGSPARLLLAEGVHVADGVSAQVGGLVHEGQTIRATGGRAVLGLSDDSRVMLERGASLCLTALGASRTELHLVEGEILVSVTPGRRGRPFVVTSVAGQVEVVGTVFSLRAEGSQVSVHVLRGEVRLRPPGERPLAVARGHAATLGSPALRVLTHGEEERDLQRVGSLGLLGGEDSAIASIHSRPTGAQVQVDGVVIGETPLVAALRPGHPLLTVSLMGRSPVKEQLTVAAGDRIRRDYEMGLMVTRAQGVDEPPAGAGGDLVAAGEAPEVAPRPAPGGASGEGAVPGAARIAAPAVRPEPQALGVGVLLGQARQHRAARDWPSAARAYQAILRHHGASAEAQAARVALGLLFLDHLGDPRGALQLFEAYLAKTRHGALAQEAAYGRIRALGRLGQVVAEKEALGAFLHYYPGALQEAAVRRRLQALSTSSPTQTSPPAGTP